MITNYLKLVTFFFLLCYAVQAHNTENYKVETQFSQNILTVSANDVLLRFYHLQRLQKGIDLLEKINNKDFLNNLFYYSENHSGITFCGYHFYTMQVAAIIQYSCEEKKLEKLFLFWHELQQYKYSNDTQIIKEFTLFLTLLLQEIESYFSKKEQHELIVLNKKLENSSLEEILALLDILVEELPKFLEKYEIDSKMSWKVWLKKYWLIAPIAGAALILRAYLSYVEAIHEKQA